MLCKGELIVRKMEELDVGVPCRNLYGVVRFCRIEKQEAERCSSDSILFIDIWNTAKL